MQTPYERVSAQFDLAREYAADASAKVDEFSATLNSSVYVAPAIDVTWVDPTLDALPAMPSEPTTPTITFEAPTEPTALTLVEPVIDISTFTESAPTLSFPVAPTISYGTAPTIPSITSPTVPDAPILDVVTVPTLLTLSTPTFSGVNLPSAAALATIPTLDLVAPTPYSYSVGADYASSLLTTMQSVLNTRLAGGTGLDSAVEQAIWDRSRSRETQIALANESEVMRQSEAFGFSLPTGVLAAQLRKTQQDYYDKLSGLSRDVAIKQAELEQENLKQTISQGIELESKLIDQALRLEQLTFDSAKVVAENAIQVYNAQVEQFRAVISAYQVYASSFKMLIDGEMAKVEVYKAELQAEQTKAAVNEALIGQYKAQIEAGMASVQIFQAQISAANTLVQLEQAKVGAAGEQVKAFVATINAETAKVEAYKAGIDAEATKVTIYKTKAEAFNSVVNAQAESARLNLGVYTSKIQAKNAEWDGYRARVDAEKARMQALASQSGALWDGYKAKVSSVEAASNTHSRIWEASIKKSEAVSNLALQQSKANTDVIIQANNARLDAAKVGSQVYAQLTSSAYAMAHVSGGLTFSSGVSNGVSYSYRGETRDPVTPINFMPG